MAEDSEVVRILRDLIRFDTSNPPGNERPAVDYIAALFEKEGIPFTVIEPAPGRANIVARLKGEGLKHPLLLSAHLDVVPALESGWEHPPFSGDLKDGFIWGRGAVDMKHMAAMSLVTMLELKRQGARLERDVIFAGVADEECGGRFGAGYLVDHHENLIASEFCLTELGGMAVPMGRGMIVPVQTAEKGHVWFKLKTRGDAGHGSMPKPGSAVARLALAVDRLSTRRLGYRMSDATRAFFSAVAQSQWPPLSLVVRGLFKPSTAPLALSLMPEERRGTFGAMLYNTVSVTSLSAGGKVNVVPETAEALVDGRYLPGVSQQQFLDEVRALAGKGVEIEVLDGGSPIEMPMHSALMESISRVMERRLPGARVVPYMIPGMTDAKHYARARITTYGFAPAVLKAGEPFAALYHAPNERLSVAALEAGSSCLYDVVADFCALP